MSYNVSVAGPPAHSGIRTQDYKISHHPKACTLHSELIGNLLAQLVYKDAIQMVAQTVTLPPPDLYQTSWCKGLTNTIYNQRGQSDIWYHPAILGPRVLHHFVAGPLPTLGFEPRITRSATIQRHALYTVS